MRTFTATTSARAGVVALNSWDVDRQIVAIGAPRQGVVTWAELLALGLSRRRDRAARATGRAVAEHQASTPSAVRTLSDVGRAHAALLAAGDAAR